MNNSFYDLQKYFTSFLCSFVYFSLFFIPFLEIKENKKKCSYCILFLVTLFSSLSSFLFFKEDLSKALSFIMQTFKFKIEILKNLNIINYNYGVREFFRLLIFTVFIAYGISKHKDENKEKFFIYFKIFLFSFLFFIFKINSFYYIIPRYFYYNKKQGSTNLKTDKILNFSFLLEELILRNMFIFTSILVYSAFKNKKRNFYMDKKIIYTRRNWHKKEILLSKISKIEYLFICLDSLKKITEEEEKEFSSFLSTISSGDIIVLENGVFAICFSDVMKNYGMNPEVVDRMILGDIQTAKEKISGRLSFPIISQTEKIYSPNFYRFKNINEFEKYYENIKNHSERKSKKIIKIKMEKERI